jgi:hypothetical protein
VRSRLSKVEDKKHAPHVIAPIVCCGYMAGDVRIAVELLFQDQFQLLEFLWPACDSIKSGPDLGIAVGFMLLVEHRHCRVSWTLLRRVQNPFGFSTAPVMVLSSMHFSIKLRGMLVGGWGGNWKVWFGKWLLVGSARPRALCGD